MLAPAGPGYLDGPRVIKRGLRGIKVGVSPLCTQLHRADGVGKRSILQIYCTPNGLRQSRLRVDASVIRECHVENLFVSLALLVDPPLMI